VKKRKPRVLRNLRTLAVTKPQKSDIEVFELRKDDTTPDRGWRCGWYWWTYSGPEEDSPADFSTLPSMWKGPFKSAKRAAQAAQAYIAANAAARPGRHA
jgi:hypothetical protein